MGIPKLSASSDLPPLTQQISGAGSHQTVTDPNDILNFRLPDPSAVLNDRFNKYSKSLKTFEAYAEGYRVIAQYNIKQFEKMNTDLVGGIPNFETISEDDNVVSGSQLNREVASVDGGHSLNLFFSQMRKNMGVSYSAAVELENKINSSVLPLLKTAQDEIDKRRKETASATAISNKDYAKTIKSTEEGSNSLNASINSVKVKGKVDYKHDPFIVKRTLLKRVAIQVRASNDRVDLLEGIEKSACSLEEYVVSVMKKAFNELTSILTNYYGTGINIVRELNVDLDQVDSHTSWAAFTQKNSKNLIGSSADGDSASLNKDLADMSLNALASNGNPLKRDFDKVIFNNQNDPLTHPVLEGILSLKEGLVMKEYNATYVVITPAGYLYGFPSKTVDSADPNIVIYLPDSDIRDESKTGKFIFKLKGKDHSNMILRTSKSFRFKASSHDDFLTWLNVLSKYTGVSAGGLSSTSDVE